jgi:hypothetical protein
MTTRLDLEGWGRPFRAGTPAVAGEHAKTFAIFGLAKTLDDFGVGSFEQPRVIDWFWRNCTKWASKLSQDEFNRYARKCISDFVGYSRRWGDAFHLVDKLFDRARFVELTLTEVVDAVAFLTKTEPLPPGVVVENGDVTIVDLTLRKDSPKLLKVDSEFFPVLQRLYRWERIDDTVVKRIPVGETATREFALHKLAWWFQNPATTYEEMQTAVAFRNGDRLDWRRANLYSTIAARVEAKSTGAPLSCPKPRTVRGTR